MIILDNPLLKKIEDKRGALSSGELTDENGLPKYYSWINFVPEVIDQGRCGSCYVITAAHMLTSRLKIKVE